MIRRKMTLINLRLGLQDTNLARVRATQTYLMQCDNIFIVANIARATTNQSVKSSLLSILARLARNASLEVEESGGKGLNIAVICTKSEVNRRPPRQECLLTLSRISTSQMQEQSFVAPEKEFHPR